MIKLIQPGGGEMKKINPIIGTIWAGTILVIVVVLYSFMETPSREGYLKACWTLILSSCSIGKYSAEVEGTITNNCYEKVHSVEVISEFYSVDGVLLFTGDPEYVQNLQPGERGVFKATVYETDSHAAACKAHITQGY